MATKNIVRTGFIDFFAMTIVRVMVEAFPWDPAPQYLLRDRDKIYGASFRHRVHSLDMQEVLTAAQPETRSQRS